MPALAGAGWRAVAPDLAGFGDSPVDPPGTWERQVEALERFRGELGVERCVPVMHDWGALIGLRWACEHPDAVQALVISSSGFFPDGKWHGMAKALRTPEVGEQALAGLDRDGFGAVLRASSRAFDDESLDEYWKPWPTSRTGATRSSCTARATSRSWPATGLADLGVPVLLVWGESDEFAPAGRRPPLRARAAGHRAGGGRGRRAFRLGRPPERCAAALTGFLARISSIERLFDLEDSPGGRTGVAAGRPAAGRAHAPRVARRVRRPGAPARRGLGAAHGDRGGPPALDDPVRAAGHRQDDARAAARGQRARGVRGGVRRQRRSRGGARGARARRAPPRHQRRAHDLLPRRDPPLQQGAAGHAAAGRGGGPGCR